MIYLGIRFFLEQGCKTEVLTHCLGHDKTKQCSVTVIHYFIYGYCFSAKSDIQTKEGNEFHIFVSSRFKTLYHYQDGKETENTGHSL